MYVLCMHVCMYVYIYIYICSMYVCVYVCIYVCIYIYMYVWKMCSKGTIHPRTDHEDPEGEQRYRPTLSLTSTLDGVCGQCNAPATLLPVKTRYPLCRRLGGPQGRSGGVQKISPPPQFDPRTVQPVANRYTDYAIPATMYVCMCMCGWDAFQAKSKKNCYLQYIYSTSSLCVMFI
jgi:hypothetical protein